MKSPLIVAEIGASHCGSLERALNLVDTAADVGADAVKLQTWTEMTVSDEVIAAGPWKGRKLRELYAEARTPWEWHRPIFDRCRARGILGFSTPFDAASVDFLESLGVLIYKVASFEITDLPLIRRVGATGKPVILSTGMATEQEIVEAVVAAKAAGAAGVTLLKCVSAYPAPAEGFNLRTMVDMRTNFGCDVGLSDHTLGSAVGVAAAALGATVIEKHINLYGGGGPDNDFASDPEEFGAMVCEVRTAAAALGEVRYGPTQAEQTSLYFRRGLWAIRDIAAGEALGADNVASRRPARGLAPQAQDRVHGARAAIAIKRGTPISDEHLA